jgi:hypothetical protein
MEEIRDSNPIIVPPTPHMESNSEEIPPNPTSSALKELDDNLIIEVIYAKPNPASVGS